MGYSIGIGEPVITVDEETRYIGLQVKKVEAEDAPLWELDKDFPWTELVGKSNFTYPSAESLDSFSKSTGLYEFFKSLIDSSDGCVLIKSEDLELIRQAKGRWVSAHPNSIPGYRKNEDDILAKLMWYEFWFEWALKNCQTPALQYC